MSLNARKSFFPSKEKEEWKRCWVTFQESEGWGVEPKPSGNHQASAFGPLRLLTEMTSKSTVSWGRRGGRRKGRWQIYKHLSGSSRVQPTHSRAWLSPADKAGVPRGKSILERVKSCTAVRSEEKKCEKQPYEPQDERRRKGRRCCRWWSRYLQVQELGMKDWSWVGKQREGKVLF